ncbi:Hypothetical_protein [Hexamita inflata]|uniref:Hypothetical_protein n=1 Tax=Hexamita inflata TaxID=28002 RepID=A0AA86RP91_9EUKA|nr:Hypothetical protein HINF_LOCUS57805 [Hexamita inflata]
MSAIKLLTTLNKSQDNIRQQKSQKITIANMTVQNLTLRQTIEAKESTQTLVSRDTKKSTIKQRSNTTKVMRPKSYQLQWKLQWQKPVFKGTEGKHANFLPAEIGYKISRYAKICNNSLYKKLEFKKNNNLDIIKTQIISNQVNTHQAILKGSLIFECQICNEYHSLYDFLNHLTSENHTRLTNSRMSIYIQNSMKLKLHRQ